jgi:phosphonate transport system permease protein
VRASVIVGAVGGGGLGTEIVGTINAVDYRRTTTLLIVLILLITLIDKCAHYVKENPRLAGLLFVAGAASLWMNFPAHVAWAHSLRTFGNMLPPLLPPEAVRDLPRLILETLEIGFGGTAFAALAALPLGLCAARNLSPAFLAIPVRRFLESLRAVPEVVWGLILVAAVGLGPQTGVLALALHTTGTLGRLYAESFENVPIAPVQAIAATGAPRIAIGAFAFVPLALSPVAVHTLFRLEWNVRAATIIGVIGAGGIGQALFDAQQLFFYKQMVAYILVTWLLVLAVDQASGVLRRRWKLLEVDE